MHAPWKGKVLFASLALIQNLIRLNLGCTENALVVKNMGIGVRFSYNKATTLNGFAAKVKNKELLFVTRNTPDGLDELPGDELEDESLHHLFLHTEAPEKYNKTVNNDFPIQK